MSQVSSPPIDVTRPLSAASACADAASSHLDVSDGDNWHNGSCPSGSIDSSTSSTAAEVDGLANDDVQVGPRTTGSAVHASAWTIGGYAAGQAIRLANNIILSHLLAPHAFGLMSFVNVVIQGLQMCSDLGVGQCIIQDRDGDRPAFYNTAWTMQVVRGVGLWAIFCVIAQPLAWFYAEPQLSWLIVALGASGMLNGLMSTGVYTARRNLRVERLTIAEVSTQLLGAVVMCVAAFYWRSVWAIVIGTIVNMLANTIASHFVAPGITNRPAWDRESARRIVSFGVWIMAGMIMAFLAMQIDRLMLPKLLPFATLGVYNLALQLTMLSSGTLDKLTASVQYPLLAALYREKPAAMNERLLANRKFLLKIALVLILGVFALAPCFFRVVIGDEFAAGQWITQWICLATWISVLTKTVDRVLLAAGNTRALVVASMVKFVVTTGAGLAGFYYGSQLGTPEIAGMQGFCLGIAFGAFVGHLVLYPMLRRYGVRCEWQDIEYSMVFLGFAAGIVALGHYGSTLSVEFGDLIGVIVPLGLAAFVARDILKFLRQRRINAVV